MPENEELEDPDIARLRDCNNDFAKMFDEPNKILNKWVAKAEAIKAKEEENLDVSDLSQDEEQLEKTLEECLDRIFMSNNPAATHKKDGSTVKYSGSLDDLTWSKPEKKIKSKSNYKPGDPQF